MALRCGSGGQSKGGHTLKYDGHNGQITVDAAAGTLTITRQGIFARTNFPKGEPNVIPLPALPEFVSPTRQG